MTSQQQQLCESASASEACEQHQHHHTASLSRSTSPEHTATQKKNALASVAQCIDSTVNTDQTTTGSSNNSSRSSSPQSESSAALNNNTSLQQQQQQQQIQQATNTAIPKTLANNTVSSPSSTANNNGICGSMSFEEISKYFEMKLEDACRIIGISTTSMKKLCRQYHIQRYVYCYREFRFYCTFQMHEFPTSNTL